MTRLPPEVYVLAEKNKDNKSEGQAPATGHQPRVKNDHLSMPEHLYALSLSRSSPFDLRKEQTQQHTSHTDFRRSSSNRCSGSTGAGPAGGRQQPSPTGSHLSVNLWAQRR